MKHVRRLIFGAVVAAAALLSMRGDVPVTSPSEDVKIAAPSHLEVSAPTSQPVGRDALILVRGAIPDMTVDIVATQGSRIARLQVTADRDGLAQATLRPPFTDRAGLVTVIAVQAGQKPQATMSLEAGQAVDPGTLVVGGRSIVADGADHAMAVALPQDDLGNPMPDGTEIDLSLRRPDGTTQKELIRMSGLLGWLRFKAITVAGRTASAAITGNSNSPETDIRETAGDPVPFTLSIIGPEAPADGKLLRFVRTSPLTDAFGNVLPDGTSVMFTLESPDGRGRAWSLTIKGIAELSIPASEQPGRTTVSAWSHGTSSPSVDVSFMPDVTKVPLVATRVGPWSIKVSVGPIIGTLGGYLADGTPITLSFGDGTNQSWTSQGSLADGVFEQTVTADDDVHTVSVSVLGVSRSVEVSP